ncbi:hypothetical protein C5167_030643 [Papaver somniferum]|uniref:homeobox protein 2-like n=1 Tax=Papaver somniferum TaxID=3469 RepID=UPI000E6F7FBC|nr:homeobox protein 2-like [Papaver somniferum]RZC88950.1 hypothetical protein C5167_030643 [Papaver somniferum]
MKSGMNNSSSATSRWGSMFGTKTTVTPRKNGDDQDDLLLFGEIHKRSEKERSNNLLQPISSDHDLLDYSVSDPNSGSNYPLYSAKKINGMEGMNDYDWLKTPPATPLFPSLEMEMDPEFVIQREIPILQPPLTRFSVNNLESKLNHRPKSPTKAAEIKEPSLLATPTNSSTQPNSNAPNPASTSACNSHNNYGFHDLTSRNISLTIYNTSDQDEKDSVSSAISRSNKYFPRQGIHDNLHRTPPNLTTASSTSTRSSSVSRARPNWQQQSSGYSSGLRSTSTAKDRPSSASRGSRYNNNSTINDNNPAKSLSADQDQRLRTVANTSSRSSSASKTRLNNNINKLSSSTDEDRHLGNQQHSHVKPPRQSVSPSMTRGRNSISIRDHKQPEINNEHASTTIVSSRGRNHPSSGGSNNRSSHNLFGSKMVDKVMNARRSTTLSSVAVVNQEREISHKQNARGFASSSLMINNEVAGFRKSSPSSAAQNQDKFESSTSSSSLPISNEKPRAGILKTSSDMALRDSKDTREINHQAANLTRNVKNSKHDHSSIRRAIEQSRVCMNVEVIKLTTVTGDKKEKRKFTVRGEK